MTRTDALAGIIALLEDPRTGDAGRSGALNLARAALSSASPPVEADPCHCRKAVPGMWTSGYDETRASFVRHRADSCVEYVQAPPTPAEGEREVGGLTREGCDERGAIINALAYVLRTTYEIEEMSDDQRDIWRTLVGRARREYDRLLALAAPRPPSSPPTNRVTGETLPEWRERMHPRPFDGDAAIPSPDPGERTDVAWATQQRVNDLVYALDCIALHAAGEPTDPAEACRLIWKVAEAARQPPAPSPAAVARCTTCGLLMTDPNHSGSPPGCPGPAAVEAPLGWCDSDFGALPAHEKGPNCVNWRPAAPPQTKEGAP